MALNAQQQEQLFQYLFRANLARDPITLLRACFSALFLGDVARRNVVLGWISAARTYYQNVQAGIDAQVTQAKADLTTDVNNLNTLETDL